jgi:hypothetical protein
MSGKKNYRASSQGRNRINQDAERRVAAAMLQAEEQKKLRDERLRIDEQEREKERNRLREIALEEAARKERDRKYALASEIQGIIDTCECELSAASKSSDAIFSTESISQVLEELRLLAKNEAGIGLVREAEQRFRQSLASHLLLVSEFRKCTAECVDAIDIVRSNKDTRRFFKDELEALIGRHESVVIKSNLTRTGPVQSVEALKEILQEAASMIVQACKLSAEYDSRNKLLEATIASLKSMGFYVTDPSFLDATRPSGPVILSANRAGERIVISIPLSGEVESNWQGLSDSVCLKDFHSFLSKLDEAGFPCEATNLDISAPPKLLQKGAKTLPRSTGESRGT